MLEGKQIAFQGELHPQANLAPYTSWRVGGPCDYLFLPKDVDDLANFLQQIPKDIPVTYLGLGSNTLIRDGGVTGIVVVTQGRLNKLIEVSPRHIRAEAGVSAGQLARYSARLSAAGLEFMAGIPGTVGGALAMNAGCFGGETWNTVQSVKTMNRHGQIRIRHANEFKVAYREVIRPEGEYFISADFVLKPGEKKASLEQIRQLLEKRNTTQPTSSASCGSVFRNPKNDYAARLIEQCGLKGMQLGGAKVSEKHANFILNEAQASAADIEALIQRVQTIVHEKTGVLLQQEVCMMGQKL